MAVEGDARELGIGVGVQLAEGAFDDLPLAQIVADFRTVYSGWLQGDATRSSLQGASFANDIEKEAR